MILFLSLFLAIFKTFSTTVWSFFTLIKEFHIISCVDKRVQFHLILYVFLVIILMLLADISSQFVIDFCPCALRCCCFALWFAPLFVQMHYSHGADIQNSYRDCPLICFFYHLSMTLDGCPPSISWGNKLYFVQHMMSKEFCGKQLSQKGPNQSFSAESAQSLQLMASTAGKQNQRKDFFLDQKTCIHQSIIAVKYQLNNHCFSWLRISWSSITD